MEGQTQNTRSTEVLQTNPIEKNRRSTDRIFIFIFLIIIFAWLGVGTKGLFAVQRQDFDEKIQWDQTLVTVKSLINLPVTSFSSTFLIILPLNIGFTVFFIFLSRKYTEFYVYVGMGLYMLFVIVSLGQTISGSKSFYHDLVRDIPPMVSLSFEAYQYIFSFLQTLLMIACVTILSKIDKNVPFNIIKDACRAVLANPILIMFAGFLSILGYFVVSFTANALISELLSERSYIMRFECVIILFGGICALMFVYNFSFMVISVHIVNCYWKNQHIDVIEKNVVSQVLRNHIGTIMFSSTLFIPSICAVVQALKHKLSQKNNESYMFYFVSKLFLTLNMPNTALILSSIYGTGFLKSSKNAFNTILRHCLLFLATLGALDALISVLMMGMILIAGLVLGLSLFFQYGAVDINNVTIDNEKGLTITREITLSLFAIYCPLFVFVILMYTSARALLINKIIILNKEN